MAWNGRGEVVCPLRGQSLESRLAAQASVRQAEMGVTIHFEGRLRNKRALARVIQVSRSFAEALGWRHAPILKKRAILRRTKDERDWKYVGPTKGITLSPHEDCDPLHLEFDQDLYVQDFIKTQFAPPSTHVSVVEVLRRLAPEFEELHVEDEGEYWATSKESVLNKHRRAFVRALKDALKERPEFVGPVRLPNGRMVDLMAKE